MHQEISPELFFWPVSVLSFKGTLLKVLILQNTLLSRSIHQRPICFSIQIFIEIVLTVKLFSTQRRVSRMPTKALYDKLLLPTVELLRDKSVVIQDTVRDNLIEIAIALRVVLVTHSTELEWD